MKKIIILITLCLTLGATGVFFGCDGNGKGQYKQNPEGEEDIFQEYDPSWK